MVSEKTGSSCAMRLCSMLNSIGFVRMSSLIFRNIFSLVSISEQIKIVCCGHFSQKVCYSEVELLYKITGVPERAEESFLSGRI